MSNDLHKLGTSMHNLADRIKAAGPRLKNLCAAQILATVVYRTPVGNKNVWLEPEKAPVGYVGGRARANWLVAVGAPNLSMVDTIDEGGGSTISTGRQTIQSSGTGTIYLTNNLPYIIPLNQGHSRQAPAGFIEVSIIDGVNAIKAETVT